MNATSKIRLLTFGSVLVTAVAISVTAIIGMQSMLRRSEAKSLRHDVLRESERLGLALQEAQHDVRLLASLPAARRILQSPNPAEDASSLKDQLAEVFRQMLRAKPTYTQVRLLGVADDGLELVRVDHVAGKVVRAADSELQAKGTRPYFRKALESPAGRVYVSPISLNRERGRIQRPHQPMLRVSQRIDDSAGQTIGIVVINQDFAELTEGLFGGLPAGQELFLTNAAGDYLVHPDPGLTFGFDLGARRLLQADYPAAGELFEAGGKDELSVAIKDPSWELLQLRRTPLLDSDPQSHVVLGVRQRRGFVDAGGLGLLRSIGVVTFVLCGACGAAAVAIGRVQTRPLEQVTQAAECVARGEPLPGLPVRLTNQMGSLARAVQSMNDSLLSRQRALTQANRELESANENLAHFVQIAAHDLREPLRKQRKLIDLLLLEEGVSRDADELLGHVGQCSHRMQALIDDFRAVAGVERSDLSQETVCLRRVIESVLDGVRDELQSRSVRVEWEDLPEETRVYPQLVRLLYENLIENALSHVAVDRFTLRLTARHQAGRWWFGVLNTGSTIPSEKLGEVFKVFRQGPAADGAGSGVGLSVCQKIAERHHGAIAAESDSDSVHIRFTLEEARVAQFNA
ncbi:Phytochrome-like protein cph1 [Posidoniimonas polymericola]|uniref:histidine kinase n=1 Tax=Posidoniimonas polymericola TaxID=2528002 RepID=A0A5C5ZE05_9BACT|nr:sensor histidine kinase [Posidoniimonas polymericola]TWT85390.1 Phytochrome-like protein cph1 [Posidoniimonas polymericola]